ncbi:MAG: single-stranded-DNA-specific exonuclease RecJ [Gemmatimonadetes bacterium]|nr:single-stranded-DNA-specific exonuclease RecJ [Gemmatimonadota bacterium]
MGRRWAEPSSGPVDGTRDLETYVGLPGPLCELLIRRGFAAEPPTRRFLRPSFEDLHDPTGLIDLAVAADRVERAIRDRETILVHGDYDVDGVTGATLLTGAFRELGARAVAFVPHRGRDGYDLGDAGIDRAASEGARLIVTADCGISAIDAVERASSRGIDVVVTDHHRPGDRLPSALAVVNPNRTDQAYPFTGLAGVGVAFKLVQELFSRKRFEEGRLNRYLDLVALGTIADQAPLVGENRTLARFGLRVLNRSRRAGVRALCRAAGVGRWSQVRAADVAFRLAPRLNSAGRIGDATDALRLLDADDFGEADRLAERIERTNLLRRETDAEVLARARADADEIFDPVHDRALVIWGEGWHHGVLGIVASRLVDQFHVPVLLIGLDGERGRGSARSVPGFHMYEALAEIAEIFERYGGHAAAAGFDIRSDRLEALRTRFLEVAGRRLEAREPTLRIDQELPVRAVSPAVARGVTYLEPFGAGNPTPRFLARGVRLHDVETVGEEGVHVRAWLEDGGDRLEAIAFRQPELVNIGTDTVDLVYELHVEAGAKGLRPQAHVIDTRAAL